MKKGKDWEGSGEWEQGTGGEKGEGLGREWRMGARDGGVETGEGLGSEWRMRARDRGD